MNELTTFNFENNSVRTFADENGAPWFCASDVCKVLGYVQPASAVRNHCIEQGVLKQHTPTSSGLQQLSFIDERNLYRLVMRSQLPAAEKFQDWICGEVTPTIRRTGSYSIKPQQNKSLLENKVDAYFSIAKHMVESVHISAERAKAYALNCIHENTGLITEPFRELLPDVKPKDQAIMNATAIGEKVGKSAKAVNQFLSSLGLIKKEDGRDWLLTEEGTKFGEARPYTRNGHSGFDIKWRSSVLKLFEDPSK